MSSLTGLVPGQSEIEEFERGTCGVADIGRVGLIPLEEAPGDVVGVEPAQFGDGVADAEGHLGVVSDIAGVQMEPSSPLNIPQHAELTADLLWRHELDRCAERVAAGAS